MRFMKTQNETAGLPERLRIALVTETYTPEINGVAITIGRMVHGLCGRGHDIHMIRPRQHRNDSAAQESNYRETLARGMPIPGYPELKSGLPAKGMLLRLWQEERPDIVHIATEGPLGWSALAAALKLAIPVSTDFHTNFHSYTQHYGIGLLKWPIAAYLRRFHNKAACTLVPTHELQKQLTEDGYRNVEVVSRGVDTELFTPERRSAELRASWGADDSTLVVMLVSRLAAEKNLGLAINAYYRMRSVNPNVRMVLVGDGPEREGLQKQHPDIIFAGMRKGERLAEHYASGDLFIYPSQTETYGNVTIEAMASGLAAIAYDYAAARQHIVHDISGVLVPMGDEQAFIQQATLLIADMERIARLRRAAHDAVKLQSWDHIMCQMETMLFKTLRTEGDTHGQPQFATATD